MLWVVADKINPDNTPSGYGGMDTEALSNFFLIFLIIACIIMLFVIVFMSCKISNLKEKINENENKKEV